MFSYQQARELVLLRTTALSREAQTESISLLKALGRILAQEILTDRDYPPFDRSIRDGYAVSAVDTHPGATLRCVGELKAGDTPCMRVEPGTCIQMFVWPKLAKAKATQAPATKVRIRRNCTSKS